MKDKSGMCNFCKTTDRLISEEFKTNNGDTCFADLRFDLDHNQLDICYGLLGEDSEWTDSLDINYCPICGRSLRDE